MNWKLRLRNKATLTALVAATLAFVWQVCGMMGWVPAISQDTASQLAGLLINLLVALGIVTDPTTSGVSDSGRALAYDTPSANVTDTAKLQSESDSTAPATAVTAATTATVDGAKVTVLTADDARAVYQS